MLSETALLNKITEPEDHAEPYSLCRFFAALSRFKNYGLKMILLSVLRLANAMKSFLC